MDYCPVCGKSNISLFRDKACLDCRIGRYVDVLNSFGMATKILQDNDPNAPYHSIFKKIGSVREACVQLEGRRIRFIELWRTDTRNVTWFTIAYLVIQDYNYNKKDIKASLGEPYSVWHEREPLKEYQWEGGLLAQLLSSDSVLKELLKPNKGQLEIRFESKSHIVAITEVVGDHYPDPELEHIEAIERIIDHILGLTSTVF